MHSKHLLKYIVILALLLFAVSAIPAAAQEGEEGAADTSQDAGDQESTGDENTGDEDTGEEDTGDEATPEVDVTETPTDTATAEPTEPATEEPTEPATEEPTEEPTDTATAEPTEPATEEPTEPATEEPTDTATAEPTEPVTVTVTVEPTETVTATVEPTATPTITITVEPTETVTATVEPTATPTVTVEPTITPTVVASPTVTATVVASPTVTATVTTADDVESAALPGSFTSQIIAIANLNTSGAAEAAQLSLDEIGDTGVGNVASPAVFPGGVSFIRDNALTSNGQFSGILSSGFPAAAAVMTVNSTAYTADIYAGLSGNSIAPILYGSLIFNRHSNIESRMFCQNASSGSTRITVRLFKTGASGVQASVQSNSLAPGEGVAWDISSTAFQNQWPGGNGNFGYALFETTPSANIACIIDNQRTATPYTSSQFPAVPATAAGQDLRLPLVYNGHGSSVNPARVAKWNSGLSLVNNNGQAANVSVAFKTSQGTHTCSRSIPANSSVVWFAPEIGTGAGSGAGWNCPSGPVPFANGWTLGSAKVTSNRAILVIANSTKRDGSAPSPAGVGWGVGYASLAAKPTGLTKRAVCPLAFNAASASQANNVWVSGIQAANVGNGPTNITFKMVRANVNPAGAGNSVTLQGGQFNNVAADSSATAYFPELGAALKSFEGAVFVTSNNQNIFVAHSATNYNSLSSAALYACINY